MTSDLSERLLDGRFVAEDDDDARVFWQMGAAFVMRADLAPVTPAETPPAAPVTAPVATPAPTVKVPPRESAADRVARSAVAADAARASRLRPHRQAAVDTAAAMRAARASGRAFADCLPEIEAAEAATARLVAALAAEGQADEAGAVLRSLAPSLKVVDERSLKADALASVRARIRRSNAHVAHLNAILTNGEAR